jgi:hypothetical protein
MTGEPNDHSESNSALLCTSESKQNSGPKNQLASDWNFQYAEVAKREGAFLPHWSAQGATYAVTFRLADSFRASRLSPSCASANICWKKPAQTAAS